MMRLSEDDAAWILGRGGSTKQKISTVSGAELSMNERESGVLEITGTRKQRRAARDYIEMIIQQRSSSVVIDIDEPREDMTGLSVPSECVAFVMGKGGATLRTLESEWCAPARLHWNQPQPLFLCSLLTVPTLLAGAH